LLREVLPPDEVRQFVVPMTGDTDADAATWGQDVSAVLRDREAAFGRAEKLRRTMSDRFPWSAAARGLLAAVRDPAVELAGENAVTGG